VASLAARYHDESAPGGRRHRLVSSPTHYLNLTNEGAIMSVKKKIHLEKGPFKFEVEVPATPEQVWEAIATGPSFRPWFTAHKDRWPAGGTITTNFGPGMDVSSPITAWSRAPHGCQE